MTFHGTAYTEKRTDMGNIVWKARPLQKMPRPPSALPGVPDSKQVKLQLRAPIIQQGLPIDQVVGAG